MIFYIPPPINGSGGADLSDLWPGIIIALSLFGMFYGMVRFVEFILGPP